MVFARVVGNVVCTRKDEKLVGMKLLLVQPVDLAGAAKGIPLVAIDAVGSGEGELVLIVQGLIFTLRISGTKITLLCCVIKALPWQECLN